MRYGSTCCKCTARPQFTVGSLCVAYHKQIAAISGLEQLVALKRLDLSFNKIRKIGAFYNGSHILSKLHDNCLGFEQKICKNCNVSSTWTCVPMPSQVLMISMS